MNDIDDDCDCPDTIINTAREPLLIKCEKCEMIPYFTLFNYDDIQLNMMCEEEHSNHLNLDIYIRKVMNSHKDKDICLKCNNKFLFCQFCKKLVCEKCNPNHFTIEHIFKKQILKDFSNEILEIDDRDINEIKEKMNKSINDLKIFEE